MTEDDLHYRKIQIAKSIAISQNNKQRVFWDSEELFKRIRKPGLEDATALLRIFEKEIKAHNAKLIAAESNILNLNYRKTEVQKSKYFRGIPFRDIELMIQAYPELSDWEIAKKFL